MEPHIARLNGKGIRNLAHAVTPPSGRL